VLEPFTDVSERLMKPIQSNDTHLQTAQGAVHFLLDIGLWLTTREHATAQQRANTHVNG